MGRTLTIRPDKALSAWPEAEAARTGVVTVDRDDFRIYRRNKRETFH